MTKEYVSLPFAKKLTKDSAWNRVEGERGGYEVIRFHLLLDDRQVTSMRECMGGRLSVHHADDAAVELFREQKIDFTTVSFRETLRETVFTEEVVKDVSFELGATIGGEKSPANAKSLLKQSIRARLEQSIRGQTAIQETVTNTREYTFNVKYTFDASARESYVNTLMYERRAVDVYVVWLDYLHVTYKRTALRLRKTRIKSPPFEEGRSARQNEIEVNFPLGSFEYWKLLPESSYMVRAKEYECIVQDPYEITRQEISDPKFHERKRWRKIPSLYQISNAAFPLKWVNRVGEWTEEELMELEHEEARETIWWFQNGPGRKGLSPSG